MATCFGGVGDTSMENPDTQDIDNASEDESQNDNIIQNLLNKTAHLRQLVEDRDNEPREAIHDLEQRLNKLTLTLCQNLMHCTKENISGEFFIARHTHIEWARLFTT